MSMLDKIKAMRQETKQVETRLIETKSYSDKMGIQDLEEGKTTVRIVKHEKDEIPFFPFRSTWLKVNENLENLSRYQLNKIITEEKLERPLGIKKVDELKDESDDKVRSMIADELGKDYTKVVNKRVFISKVHGNSEVPDLVEEYVKFAQSYIKGISQDDEETKRKIAPIRGYRDKQGKWNPGILPSTSFVFYCILPDTDESVKRFEIWQKHMDEIEKLYASFDDDKEPLTIDPFSDHKEGVPLIFERFKNDKNKTEYNITDKKNTLRTGTFRDFVKQFELKNTQIKELNELTPLSEIYSGIYGKRDFELALNGLSYFDSENKINIFENDEFLDIVEGIAKYYDGEEEKPVEKKEVKKEVEERKARRSEKVEEKEPVKKKEEEVEEGKSLYGNSIDELKDYIKKEGLGIRVTKRMGFDDVVEAIEEVLEEMREAKHPEDKAEDDHTSDDSDDQDYSPIEDSDDKEDSFSKEAEEPKPSIDVDDLRARLRNRRK